MTDPINPGVSQPTPYAAPVGSPAGKTNTMAIVALVLGIVLPLGGIIVGHLALSQIKKTGEAGRGLALTGTILGYVFTAFYILAILISVILPLAIVGSSGYGY
ncbi:MAG: DUF4190 domain-containing protein [Microbacteriaceae bacterium]